jgi:hypothetical protein
LKINFNNFIISMPSSSKCLLPLRSPQITLFTPLPRCTSQMPPHISFNHPVTFSQQHWPWSSTLCTLLHSTVSQFLSPINISLSTLFSLSLCSSFSIRQHVLRPYTNRQSYISVYINFYNKILEKWRWDQR